MSIPLRPLRCWSPGDRFCAVLYSLLLVTMTNAAVAVLGQGDQEALGLHEDSEGKAVPARDLGTAAYRLHSGGTPHLGTVCWRLKGGQDRALSTCLLCDQAAPALSPPSATTPRGMAVSSHAGLHRVQASAAAAPTDVEYTGSMHSCMAWQGAKAETSAGRADGQAASPRLTKRETAAERRRREAEEKLAQEQATLDKASPAPSRG